MPFDVKIPEEEQDKRLAAKLKRELPGILAWIVRGCLEWQREGLGEPDEVKNATEGYRSDMDVLAAFIAECCVVAPNATAKATPLYMAYKAWCEESGEAHETQRRFGMRLTERNFEREKVGGSYRWHGIGLRHDEPGPFDDNGPVSKNNEFAAKTTLYDGPSGPSGLKNNLNAKNLPHEAVISKSGPDGPKGPDSPVDDRLTDEEVARIKELKRQGVAGHVARDEVLRKRHGGNGALA